MPVSLSKSEYVLLLSFLEKPQRPLSREHLLQATRVHEDIFDRSIDVQVLRLPAEAGGGSERAARNPDRARHRLYFRAPGPVVLTLAGYGRREQQIERLPPARGRPQGAA
jgi:hypothetical protein